MTKYTAIAVWGGASKTTNEKYKLPMYQVGELLAQNNITLVYGIGDEGVMGATFNGVRAHNGHVMGITTEKLLKLQCANPKLFHKNEIIIVDNLHVRKKLMIQNDDAFIIGPGGWGTLDELSEFAVSIQTKETPKKPLIFLNIDGFWNPLKQQINLMMRAGTLNQDKIDFMAFIDSVDKIFPTFKMIEEKIHPQQ